MEFIIVNTCPLQNDALESYVRQTYFPSRIRIVTSMDVAIHQFSKQKSDGLILSTSVLDECICLSTRFRDFYMNKGSKVNVVLFDNSEYFHIAQLLTMKPTLVVDKHDAKLFFESVRDSGYVCDYYISPSVQAAIGEVPGRFHPLWSLNQKQLLILSHILQNQSSKAIADLLGKSPATIEDYRKKIKERILVSGGKLNLNFQLKKYLYWIVLNAKSLSPQ